MDNQNSIAKLKRRQKAQITGFTTEELPIKLFEMGLFPGVEIEIKSKLPFKGPLTIQVNNGEVLIALRNAEAQSILIETI